MFKVCLFLVAFIICLIAISIPTAISRSEKCKNLNGVMVREVCFNKSAIIELK